MLHTWVQAIFQDLCSVSDVPAELGPLAAAEGAAGKAARLAVARCLLVSQSNLLPHGVDFSEVFSTILSMIFLHMALMTRH